MVFKERFPDHQVAIFEDKDLAAWQGKIMSASAEVCVYLHVYPCV